MSIFQKTKWLTENFENLKGLITVPIGIVFLLLAFWNALQLGITPGGKDIGLPMLMITLAILSTILISQYYKKKFGKVKPLVQYQIRSAVIVVAFLILYFFSKFLDAYISMRVNHPVSIESLMWAIFFIIPFLTRKQTIYLVFSILFIILALLPAFGLLTYESVFDPETGVWGYLLIGLAMIIGGMVDHFTLVSILPATAGEVE
jgi:hypothetical protein